MFHYELRCFIAELNMIVIFIWAYGSYADTLYKPCLVHILSFAKQTRVNIETAANERYKTGLFIMHKKVSFLASKIEAQN